MTTTTHQRSMHIDAPVEKVFAYVKDPHHLYGAFPQEMTVSGQQMAPDGGEGSTWKVGGHVLFIPVSATATRKEFVPNKRLADEGSTGVVYAASVEPDEAGTTLTLTVEVSSRVPFLDKVEDKVFWNGDRDIDSWLGNVKQAIET